MPRDLKKKTMALGELVEPGGERQHSGRHVLGAHVADRAVERGVRSLEGGGAGRPLEVAGHDLANGLPNV